MATDSILKDAGEVYARLLDHRAILHGEINYFLTEFEKRRSDSEYRNLQKMLETTQVMLQQLPDSRPALDSSLPALTTALKAANDKCDEILKSEGTSSKDNFLSEQRATRTLEWHDFMEQMCEASDRIDQQHEQEVDTVRHYYTDIEKRLHIKHT